MAAMPDGLPEVLPILRTGPLSFRLKIKALHNTRQFSSLDRLAQVILKILLLLHLQFFLQHVGI